MDTWLRHGGVGITKPRVCEAVLGCELDRRASRENTRTVVTDVVVNGTR